MTAHSPASTTAPLTTQHPQAALTALLVVVTAITAELARMSGPLIDAAFTTGVIAAAVTAVGTYAAAGLFVLALCVRRPIDGRVVLLAVVALAVGRVATQGLSGSVRYGTALATVALSVAIVVVVAAAVARVSGRAVAAGVGGGLAVSAALNLALRTWDSVWRPGALGWLVALALVATAVTLAWRLRALPAAPAVRGLWLIGPYLGLAVMTFANPAFISSQAGLPLWLSGLVIIVAALGTAGLLALPAPDPTRLPAWTDAIVVVVSGGAAALVFFTIGWPHDPGTVVSVLVAASIVLLAGSTTIALAQALTRPVHRQRSLRLAGAATCAGLGLILPLLVYQLDYDLPLPVPNVVLPVAVAVLISGMSVRARIRARVFDGEVDLTATPLAMRVQGPALVATALLGLVGIAMVVPTGAPSAVDRMPGSFRLLDWNLHYGVSAEPAVELSDMAAVIRESGADVVTLQEVSRGWVMGGGADMATYLSQELDMEFVFVPAADRQFGNVIMWKPYLGELTGVERTALPFGDGPQSRSAISGTLTDGVPVRITSVHLQHRAENTPTRLEQLSVLLEAQPVSGAYLLAGDLNAEPGWPEPHMLAAAGLVSAQDSAGNPADLTHPSLVPDQRIDWVFGSGVTFTNFAVLDTQESDHRPLVTTVTVDAVPTP
ncbi:Metal-dependent hydrolase, endonuclease/exonuclease/phosphatase family [Sanguibacter gelidistatuariae]|uniref:Metal-dependent hydrolase, endonuclease/exonuclease/phosphatase family n=1 Tax=Sanguibacter gelidistatuariae TaxID=1814289 RepID=A0A1G6MMQ7_9MICO|nr:endonuclease/exonuclease/phosphatase family protein [Sanguibacter gelidistatuariae]SDC56255.1 Metal-dependent hydrolase, endonuclease/exonuclease/phosphatase family [Sanguibacter gelidistatuariae]